MVGEANTNYRGSRFKDFFDIFALSSEADRVEAITVDPDGWYALMNVMYARC